MDVFCQVTMCVCSWTTPQTIAGNKYGCGLWTVDLLLFEDHLAGVPYQIQNRPHPYCQLVTIMIRWYYD